jgi:predicted transcriptional regulator
MREAKRVTSTRCESRGISCLRSEDKMTTATAKEQIRKMLDELPEEASFEDIQYHIYVRQKIERGIQDVAEGRVVDEDEAERRLARWLEG